MLIASLRAVPIISSLVDQIRPPAERLMEAMDNHDENCAGSRGGSRDEPAEPQSFQDLGLPSLFLGHLTLKHCFYMDFFTLGDLIGPPEGVGQHHLRGAGVLEKVHVGRGPGSRPHASDGIFFEPG